MPGVFTSNYNYSYDCIQISDAYSLSTSYDVWMINSGSKAPAAAARFLNLLYTDADLHNFITYGEKGVDYELNEDGFVVPPEGYESLADVPYTNNLNYPYWGSKWLPYRTLGGLTDEEAEVNKKQNYDALLSSFYGSYTIIPMWKRNILPSAILRKNTKRPFGWAVWTWIPLYRK